MTIHILGICGTFMAGIAAIAKEAGFTVTGSDEKVYPPMSTQLENLGITLHEGYDSAPIEKKSKEIIVGNALSRGKPVVEYMLNHQLTYTSGPQWLYENVLKNKWVLAVAGTHGKTTTSSMLAWILEYAGLEPGFLIGGVPSNFDISARLGKGKYFVIEADEYDTAFFDKRSKFIHYHPKTLILNNLEYDHADIFENLEAIKKQFHYLVRTVPGEGMIVLPKEEKNLLDVIQQGCWSTVSYVGETGLWQAKEESGEGSAFSVTYDGKSQGVVTWSLMGKHNISNALCAMAAAHHAGVSPATAIKALCEFKGVKRRMELRGVVKGVSVYDDFAHHPTAVTTTLSGLRKRVGNSRIIAVMEFGSYTMKAGVHRDTIIPSLQEADSIFLAKPEEDWGLEKNLSQSKKPIRICQDVNDIIQQLKNTVKAGDTILVMSNKGFGGIYDKLLKEL